MAELDILFIGAVMNYDGQTGSLANYIKQGERWITPHQYMFQQRPAYFRDEAHACVYDVPNLSICELADYMKRHVPDVKFHVVWHFDYHKDVVLDILRNRPPHLVAISTTLAFYPKFLNEAVAWINERKLPRTKVVLGGKWIYDRYKLSGASATLESVLCESDADYVVLNSYGQEALRQLLLAERAGDLQRAQSLPSVCYRTRHAVVSDEVSAGVAVLSSGGCGSGHHGGNGNGNGHSHANGNGHRHQHLAGTNGGLSLSILSAEPSVLAYSGSHYRINKVLNEDQTPGRPMLDFDNVGKEFLSDVVHVRTCSSCPFKCKFCTFPVLQGDHVLFDIDDVMTQLLQLKSMGVKHLFIIDDTFNVPRDRFEVLMDRFIKADLGMQWVSFYRAQFATRDLVKKMYDAGCRMVFCGFESGNDHILKLMSKTVTVAKYHDGLEFLHNADIKSIGSYIVGYPGETYETAMDTLRLIDDPRVDFSRGSLFYYEPSAPVAQMADEWELVGYGSEWSHKTMNSKQAAKIHLEMIDKLQGVNTPVSDGGAWSVYNLFARGMGWDDIKALYREFNALQKSQIIEAGRDALSSYRAHARVAPAKRKRTLRKNASVVEAMANVATPDF